MVIEILYCGVCHSDLHHVHNDWGRNSIFPMVPGHEIIGRVLGVGSDVDRFKPGDHVGVGCLVDSCHHCAACEQGLEQYCEEHPTLTYDDVDRHDHSPTYGGYSDKIVVSDQFVLKIPDGLDLKGGAPLLCAGITTWSPLRHWNVGKGTNVAVVGSIIGGIAETQEMLDFCGQHKIASDVEVIKIQEINEAFERMLKSDVKYRFVIDMASLKEPA